MAVDGRVCGWADGDPLPAELLLAKAMVFDPHGLPAGIPVPEPESAAYGAHMLTVKGRAVRFRVAGTTPTKSGQFVTLWQRSTAGPIRPFDLSDGVDLFVVGVRDGAQRGQFVFPVAALARRGVVSRGGAGGKRAMRVYAPWVAVTSAQAARTQAWQREFFLPLDGNLPLDAARVYELYAA